MSISPAHIIEARRLLRRGSTWLARAAHVDYRMVVSVQQGNGGAGDPSVLAALRRALEAAGVEFMAEAEGTAAVRLRIPMAAGNLLPDGM